MKLRYRIEDRGWYIPQYFSIKTEEWKDFKLGDLGSKHNLIHDIAYRLGESDRWNGNTYHFNPNGKHKKEDMPLIFKNELKVCAFLGAAKIHYGERTKEVEL
jgi:hypothetical protein